MKTVTTNELKVMEHSEGLILQGCGGELQEWVDGINNMLTEAEILKNGGRLSDVSVFEHNGLTNLLFSFDNLKPHELDMGKLAMWRLATHDNFGGTWLSDYQVNQLGMVEQDLDTPQFEQTM